MNLVPHFNSVEKKLNGLSRIEKFQLYTIPIVVVLFILYNFTNIKTKAHLKPTIQLERNVVNTYSFLQTLQEFTKSKSLTIINLKQNGSSFSINIEGEFQNIMEFIFFCESYQSINEIETLKITHKENTLDVFIQFVFSPNKYVLSDNEKKQWENILMYNPFITEDFIEHESLVLNAIVNQEALINNIWMKKGDVIGEYKIQEIQAHFVELEHHNEGIKRLKLLKE